VKAARVLWVGGILCLGGIALGVQFRTPAVAPAAVGSATSTELQAESRMVASFADFAGSDVNARSLVAGLRQGGEIALTAPGSGGKGATSIRFSLPTRPMDYGNVRISLTLAREQLAQLGIRQPNPAQIKAVLAGGAVTSRSTARTTPVLLPGLLPMRAHGMDWNRIADSMGVKLGDAMYGRVNSTATGALAAGPAAPGIAASAVMVTGAQGEAPTQGRAGTAQDSSSSGSTRPGKVAGVTPTVSAQHADTKPAVFVNRSVPRAPPPADPLSTTLRADKGSANTAAATTGPAVAGLSQEMRNPGTGVTAARETGVTAVAAAVPVPDPAIDPLALTPATRVDLPAVAGERGPAPAEPAD
jgi:hypothetical protein